MSNPFEELLTSTIWIAKPDGISLGPFKAAVDAGKITLFETQHPISTRDKVVRDLPNGTKETYIILEAQYQDGLYEIPPSYELTVQKEDSASRQRTLSNINIFNRGDFSRVNLFSEDRSVNVQENSTLFDKIESAIKNQVGNTGEAEQLLRHLEAMKSAGTKAEKADRYGRFVQAAANHITIISPFLPTLLNAIGLGS